MPLTEPAGVYRPRHPERTVVFGGNAPDHQPWFYLQTLSGGAPKPITPDGSACVWSYRVAQSDLFRLTGLK